MDFLERLERLMSKRGVNKSQLAEGAHLPKTTVYGWWASGYESITLPKLKALSAYFGCSLDYIVNGDEIENSTAPQDPVPHNLTEQESQLLFAFRTLNADGRTLALQTIQTFAGNPAMTEESIRSTAI